MPETSVGCVLGLLTIATMRNYCGPSAKISAA